MNIRNIELNDNIENIHDTKKFIKSVSKKPQYKLHGEVSIYNQLGECILEKNNIILIGGRRFTLEKLFNIQTTADRKKTLNSIFNVNITEPTNPNGLRPLEGKCVSLFGCGRGGSSLTFNDVNKPATKEFNLYDMIPIRYVAKDNDLDAETKAKYYLRVEEDEHIAYYLKKFETDPKLVMKIGESDYYPSDSDNLPTDWNEMIEREDVDVYVELQMKITADDYREYYKETEGLEMARINELGLFLGYRPNTTAGVYQDYLAIEDFSKLTFNNEPLDDETKELYIVYRIFV